jgi:hypothetical protein
MTLSLNDYLSDVGIIKWIEAIGVTNAPLPRRNVGTALAFFSNSMPSLPPEMAANFLRAMDLSRPVTVVTLKANEPVIAFRVGNESPFKLFYTRPGASQYSSGINPAGRSVVKFVVRIPTQALESYTTGAIDVWTLPASDQALSIAPRGNTTGVMVPGGGVQLIIPRSPSVLLVV